MDIQNENNGQEEAVNSSQEIQSDTTTLIQPPTGDTLTVQEKQDLDNNEEAIKKGAKTFLEVGKALTDIRDRRLYREKYQSFDKYCNERWSFGRTHAYRLIDAATVYSDLTPIGDRLPTCESQVRPLVGLDPAEANAAWNSADEAAGENPVTTKLVEVAAAKFKNRKQTKTKPTTEAKAKHVPQVIGTEKETANDEAFMNMDAALHDLKKVKRLDASQKKEWSTLLNDIVTVLGKLGVEVCE